MKTKKEEIKTSISGSNSSGKIIFWLDSYYDLFSDFDPRPLSKRALSVDFLDEAKRASIDKRAISTLNILIPNKLREIKKERIISQRLKTHSKRHEKILDKEHKKIINKGTLFIISGIILMFLAALFLFTYQDKIFFTTFLVILLEPGGWFLFWEGLDLVIFEGKKRKPDLEFYRKISKSKIEFGSY